MRVQITHAGSVLLCLVTFIFDLLTLFAENQLTPYSRFEIIL